MAAKTQPLQQPLEFPLNTIGYPEELQKTAFLITKIIDQYISYMRREKLSSIEIANDDDPDHITHIDMINQAMNRCRFKSSIIFQAIQKLLNRKPNIAYLNSICYKKRDPRYKELESITFKINIF